MASIREMKGGHVISMIKHDARERRAERKCDSAC